MEPKVTVSATVSSKVIRGGGMNKTKNSMGDIDTNRNRLNNLRILINRWLIIYHK